MPEPKRDNGRNVFSVSTLEEFLQAISTIRAQWKFDDASVIRPWYRGQQRKHWSLIPNIIRVGCFDRESEDSIREEFATRAPGLSHSDPLPINDWDLYFLMQHYGAPTRLLDWTESPVIALYFAVRDNPGHYDSSVWMLDPYKLNKASIKKSEVISPSALAVNPRDVKRVSPWLPARWSKTQLPDWPLAVFPTHIARRISSQRSCFTIHGRRESGFYRFASRKDPCLKKIIIPARAVHKVQMAIQNYGIDDTTIFPDLEGLAHALATSYRDLKADSPHRGVYVRLKPSKIHRGGIGVFAIRSIPQDTRLFADENEEVVWKHRDSLPKKNMALRKLYDDFSIIKGDYYGCPVSFNRLTPAWFMNESKNPNTICDENYDFYSLRNIKTGEELTIDYATFSDYPLIRPSCQLLFYGVAHTRPVLPCVGEQGFRRTCASHSPFR